MFVGSWSTWGLTALMVGMTVQVFIYGIIEEVLGIPLLGNMLLWFVVSSCCWLVIGMVAGHRYDQFVTRFRFRRGDTWGKILVLAEVMVHMLIWGLCILLLTLSVRWFR